MKKSRGRSGGSGNYSRGLRGHSGPNQHVSVVKDSQSETFYDDDDDDDHYEDHYLFNVRGICETSTSFNFNVSNVPIKFMIDSGATCNVITASDFEMLSKFVCLRNCNKNLYPYGVTTPLKVRGEFSSKIESPSGRVVWRQILLW